jgi:hypothetical protein
MFVYNPMWVWWGCGVMALFATVLFVLATKDTPLETEVAGTAS